MALERIEDLGPVGAARCVHDLSLAAYIAAAARRLLEKTAEHARARKQFGRAIGEFQAVAHPLADCVIALDSAATLARGAAWKLDAGTRTLRAEVDVDNADWRLRPGMYAYADLKIAERPNVLALPRTALWSADWQSYCFVIDASELVRKRQVTTGIRAGDDVEIVAGLAEGEQVIGVNPAAFRDGQKVDVGIPPGK